MSSRVENGEPQLRYQNASKCTKSHTDLKNRGNTSEPHSRPPAKGGTEGKGRYRKELGKGRKGRKKKGVLCPGGLCPFPKKAGLEEEDNN